MRHLKPTPEGITTLVLSGFLFMLATNLMAGWLFFLVAFLVALLVVGALSALLAVRSVEVEVGAVAPVAEGGTALVPLAVRTRRRARFIRVAALAQDQRGEAFLPLVRPGAPQQTVLRIPAPSRGVYPLGALQVISPGIVGMFRVERRVRAVGEVVVGPRYQMLPDLPQSDSEGGGSAQTRHRRGGELFGIRRYVPGDPARHIHWRSSARHGRLLVKEFEEPTVPLLAIVVDADRSQTPADLDRAARAAASLAYTACARGREVTLLWCGDSGDVVRRGRWEYLWDALARVRAEGPPLYETLERLAAHLPPETTPIAVAGRSSGADAGAAVLIGPAGAGTPWEHDGEGRVRWAAS